MDKVIFLGYIVWSLRVHMELERINIVKNWLEMKSIREIQLILEFANFYTQFIQNFSAIAGSLRSMLKTGPGSTSP